MVPDRPRLLQGASELNFGPCDRCSFAYGGPGREH